MKVQVGDYKWRQLSMWDIAPVNCIEKFVRIGSTGIIAHYVLERVDEVHGDGSWRTTFVTSTDSVPEKVLKWSCDDYYIRSVGKTERVF